MYIYIYIYVRCWNLKTLHTQKTSINASIAIFSRNLGSFRRDIHSPKHTRLIRRSIVFIFCVHTTALYLNATDHVFFLSAKSVRCDRCNRFSDHDYLLVTSSNCLVSMEPRFFLSSLTLLFVHFFDRWIGNRTSRKFDRLPVFQTLPPTRITFRLTLYLRLSR